MANLLNKKIEDHQNYETDGQTRAEQKGSGKHVVWIALLVLFAAPVGAPLLAAFAAVVLALVVCVFLRILLCVVLCLMLIGKRRPCPRYTGSPVFYERFCNAYRVVCWLWALASLVYCCAYICKWSSMLIAKLVRRITGRKEREVRTMKRWAKAWLAVGVGCCVCGAALTGIGVASGGSKYVKSADLNKMDGAAKKAIMRWFLKSKA